MVANSIQNPPAFVDSGQHSIVTAPDDTGPSPRMRNLILRGSESTSFFPAPVVALSCNGSRTLIIVAIATLLHRYRAFGKIMGIRSSKPKEITSDGGLAAICRRWRTVRCGKSADGTHIPSQTERSVLLALSGLTARGVSIRPRKQRTDSIRQFAIGAQFGSPVPSYPQMFRRE